MSTSSPQNQPDRSSRAIADEGQWKIVPPRRRARVGTTSSQFDNGQGSTRGQQSSLGASNNSHKGSTPDRQHSRQPATQSPNIPSPVGVNAGSNHQQFGKASMDLHSQARVQRNEKVSPVIVPTGYDKSSQISPLTSMLPSDSVKGKQAEVSSKALVLVEKAITRASKKRVFEEQGIHVMPMNSTADQSLGTSTRDIALIQRSCPGICEVSDSNAITIGDVGLLHPRREDCITSYAASKSH
ncbi:hypothetical protein QJS10_CPA01g01195 [Acorus calamus]|uniref:Uncharacterized protein n=1 Tax=Acorus calamus TaxID=4465 RepID=A0AAV9FGI2_ACOCL|nr:hypothetical protein QJS10_CPA01g01195 [Acorus calamus]